MRNISISGRIVTVGTPGGLIDSAEFATEDEARQRAAIVLEAMSWIGTPFKNCSDVKGPLGGVDCAMLLVRSYVDTGKLEPFDPRPYPAQWHLHNDDERFLEWVVDKLGGREIDEPHLGDVLVYRFGRCFSHGAIYVGNNEVVHASFHSQVCLLSDRETTLLRWFGKDPRPVKFFEVGQ